MDNEAQAPSDVVENETTAPVDSEVEEIGAAQAEATEAQTTEAQTTEAQTTGAETTEQRVLSDVERVALLEALLLANGDPLSLQRIQDVVGLSKGEILAAADKLQAALAEEGRGIELVVVAEKLQLRTKAVFAEQVRQLMAVKPRKLSQAALETLAVVAYQQPVVKSEIDKIRGVDVAPTIKTLLERKLVKIIGYQASVGQPALYGTTEDFLQVFGLSALSELPTLSDLKALVKEPGEAGSTTVDSEQEESQAEVAQVAESHEQPQSAA